MLLLFLVWVQKFIFIWWLSIFHLQPLEMKLFLLVVCFHIGFSIWNEHQHLYMQFFFLSNLDVNGSIFLQSLHYILTGSLNKLPWNVPHELLKRMSFKRICSSELTVCFHIVANSELFLSQKIKENLIPYDIWPLVSHDQFESLHGDISCKRTKL